MMTDSNCTIYNKYVLSGKEKFQLHQIISPAGYSVHWENRKASNVLATGGNIAADQAYIYVPIMSGTGHLDPKAWQALVNKSLNWTIQVGDYIVKDLVPDVITDAFTITMLKAKYDNVLQIKSVDYIEYGSVAMHHWKIGAG